MDKSNIQALIKPMQQAVGAKADGLWGAGSTRAMNAGSQKWAFKNKELRQFSKKYGQRGLTQKQVNGFDDLLLAVNDFGDKQACAMDEGDITAHINNPLYIAYILATVWHETASKMQPIAEYGKGRTRSYGRWETNSKGEEICRCNGKATSYYLKSVYPHLYYGRGDVQLTWWDNYKLAGEMLGIDLLNNPDLMLDSYISKQVIIQGMLQGWFTTKALNDYIFYGSATQFENARRIINGTDKDDLIAKYAYDFLGCLEVVNN